MRKKSTADAKKAHVPRVGLLFVVNGNQRPELPPQLAMRAERKQSRLGDAPLGRRLLQCKVRPAGLVMRSAVFACVFF
jgi:hypothetical protein